MKLMLASQFAELHFVPESKPASSTLRRWIEEGVLPGIRIGNNYYVDVHMYEARNDELVTKVLEHVSKTA